MINRVDLNRKRSRERIMFTLGLIMISIPFCVNNTFAQTDIKTMRKGEGTNMIFMNGKIYTMDDDNPRAEAIVVDDDKIVFVGDNKSAKEFQDTNSQVIHLEGKTVVPGLIDAHAHFLSLGKKLQKLDLVGTASPEEIQRMVLNECLRVGPDQWIYGRGWDQNDWDVKAFPTWQDLLGSESNPVYLSRIAGHSYWVNKTALDLAGITRETPDPEGGRIVRAEDGEPTGILIDNAKRLIDDIVPDPTHEELADRAMLAQQECVKLGLTGVGDAGIDSAEIEVYKDLFRNDKLKIRIYAMYDTDEVDLDKYYPNI